MAAKVHVLVPHTTEVACGAAGFSRNAFYREQVTCALCRATDLYRQLPNLPAQYRKTKKERRK